MSKRGRQEGRQINSDDCIHAVLQVGRESYMQAEI